MIKAALKLETFLTSMATNYFSSTKGNAWILLVILSLNPPPATLHETKCSSSHIGSQDDKGRVLCTAYLK